MNMKTRTALFLLGIIALSGAVLSGCKDNSGEDDTVLKPMSEHILGRWERVSETMLKDGRWEEVEWAKNTMEAYEFYPDGKVYMLRTIKSGTSMTIVTDYKIDEENSTLEIFGTAAPVLRLTENEFVYADTVDYIGGKEQVKGDFRWLQRRVDPSKKYPVEKYLGKWVLSSSYEKKDGRWSEITVGKPDEYRHSYEKDGTMTIYRRTGDNVREEKRVWGVNCTTGAMQWFDDWEGTQLFKLNVTVDGDTMTVLYCKDIFDTSMENTEDAEFKDVLILAQ